MPLFVDLHYIHAENFTEEDAFRAHLLVLNVEDKFGVTDKNSGSILIKKLCSV